MVASSPGFAHEDALTVYSARHYQSDRALFDEFSRRTGIRVNLVQGGEDELLERIRSDGANGPADVFITVDAARLGEADHPYRTRNAGCSRYPSSSHLSAGLGSFGFPRRR